MHIRKHHAHTWWWIVTGIVIVNALFFFGIQYMEQPRASLAQDARNNNDYLALTATTGEQTVRSALAFLKRGDVQWARERFLSLWFEQIPSRSNELRKAMVLRSKDDLVWAEQVLEHATHEDPIIRSLFLWVRAYLYCLQKKWLECQVLAEDSTVLDPLSAFGLQTQWIVASAQRKFEVADLLFSRANKLAGICSESMCIYFRGIMRFYRAQYAWAMEDLGSLTDDIVYAYDARLFLGRTYLNQKEYDLANTQFASSREIKWWVDWTSELRLARTAIAQDDIQKALDIYRAVYLSWTYGTELVTDYMLLAYHLGDIVLLKELADHLKEIVWATPAEYLLVARAYREIGEVTLATNFIDIWRELVAKVDDTLQRDIYLSDLMQQEHHILVKRIYNIFTWWLLTWWVSALVWTWMDEWTWAYWIEYYATQLDTLAVDPQQIAFLRWLDQIIAYGRDSTWSGFQLLNEVPSTDIPLIRFWYVLFRGDAKRALQILTEMDVYQSDDTKMLWMKWAVTTRLQQEQLSARYLYQLKEKWALQEVKDILSLQQLWKECFRQFSPRMQWMIPYFPVDSRWIKR